MSTERSDKLYSDWRSSTEKFDYFIVGVVCALCAFVAQGYRPARLGVNPGTLELIALLAFVWAVIAGFRRIENTLLVSVINQRELHASEARGGMVAKMSEGRLLLNEATGETYTPEQAIARVAMFTETIRELQPLFDKSKAAALVQYRRRNRLALLGFLLLLSARVWSAYT